MLFLLTEFLARLVLVDLTTPTTATGPEAPFTLTPEDALPSRAAGDEFDVSSDLITRFRSEMEIKKPSTVYGGFVLFCFIGVLDLYCGFKASLVVLSKSSQVKVSCLS